MTNPKGWNSTPAHLRSVDPQDLSAVIQALGAAADEIERLERELSAAQERTPEACVMLEEENAQLRGNLSLAEEGLANATQEIERLRSLLAAACERNGGVCAYGNGNEADRDPCTPENCSTARAAHEPGDSLSVRIPTSEREAELMAKLGMQWLEQHAPHRLKSATEPDSLNFESIREDYQALTGVCPLPGPPSTHSAVLHRNNLQVGASVTITVVSDEKGIVSATDSNGYSWYQRDAVKSRGGQ